MTVMALQRPILAVVDTDPPSVRRTVATELDAPQIAIDRLCAIGAASIAIVLIAIIAFFNTGLHHAIAAASRLTIVQASVGLRLILIIAGFNASLDQAITTTRRNAVI